MTQNTNSNKIPNQDKNIDTKPIKINNLTAKPIENKPNPQDEHKDYTKFGDWSINGHAIDF